MAKPKKPSVKKTAAELLYGDNNVKPKKDALGRELLDCGHLRYWKLNDKVGCIHDDHGPYPPLWANPEGTMRA